MTVEEMIEKSLKPVLDNMDGSYSIGKLFKKSSRGVQGKRIKYVRHMIKHCSVCFKLKVVSCGDPDNYTSNYCSPKCKKTDILNNLKPIEYDGKLYTLDDCFPSDFIESLNPIKKHVDGLIRRKKDKENGKLTERASKYRRNNLEKCRQIGREHYWRYREEKLKYNRMYRISPKGKKTKELYEERTRDKRNLQLKNYRINNPGKQIIRNLIHNLFAKINQKKFASTSEMGFDIEGIIKSLRESAIFLGFKGLKAIKSTGLYHVDHIICCNEYDLENHKERLKCSHPINLRWLPAKENMSRGDTLRPEDIEIIKTLPTEIYPKSWGGVIPV